jgi:TRAP-type mannitol/chloroaromatic compound transport system permease large subunit
MKGVAPADVTMGEIIRAAIPYFIMNLIIIGLILVFPSIALWLPSMM